MSDAANRRIADLINDIAGQMAGFVDTLEEEQDVLTKGALDRLLPLAARKTEFANRLAELDEERLRYMREIQSSAQPDSIAWLDAVGQPNLRQTWRKTLDLVEKARHLNAINGKLIAERMRHNQQALTILMTASEQSALYGPDGQPRLSGSGRPLGSA